MQQFSKNEAQQIVEHGENIVSSLVDYISFAILSVENNFNETGSTRDQTVTNIERLADETADFLADALLFCEKQKVDEKSNIAEVYRTIKTLRKTLEALLKAADTINKRENIANFDDMLNKQQD